ncbi:TPA: hypothetical protein G8M64_005353 [Salmonella enterica]|nr:hypothetical protein [Salmonella enterica]
MKKLIIAAGIAAATMASFGASAVELYSAPSHASVNTVVKAPASIHISSIDKEVELSDFAKLGTEIGTFQVGFEGSNTTGYTDILVEKIHAHGYPSDFKISLNGVGGAKCEVTTGATAETAVNTTGKTAASTCDFSLSDAATIVVKTNQTSTVTDADAGTKTITAQFRAYKA